MDQRLERRAVLFLATVIYGAPCPARADNPLNSSDRTSRHAEEPRVERTEFTIVPLVGGSTDIGFGGGEFSGLARLAPDREPYEWNFESSALFTVRPSHGALEVAYQDYSLKLTIPRFAGRAVRLEARAAFTSETLNYFGLGNASTDAQPSNASSDYFAYERTHPELEALFRWRVVDHIAGTVGVRYVQDWLQVAQDSKLWQDMSSGTSEVRSLLGKFDAHAVVAFDYGIRWDDRDSEVSSHRGSFHELDLKLSPGGSQSFPYRYAQGSLVSRVFVPVPSTNMVLAARLVCDALIGDPPFYELARFDDTTAFGGPNGVRGVVAQRYYGKIKVFGNLELRDDLFSFRALGERLKVGVAVFLDAGRVWADASPHPELDGTGLGLKYGTGLGPRIQSGETFVLRADVAWSPDARPLGAYLAAGQMF